MDAAFACTYLSREKNTMCRWIVRRNKDDGRFGYTSYMEKTGGRFLIILCCGRRGMPNKWEAREEERISWGRL